MVKNKIANPTIICILKELIFSIVFGIFDNINKPVANIIKIINP
jgi:hypothetical protein